MSRLRDLYKAKVVPALMERFQYGNINAVPRMEKVVVSMGVGRAVQDKKFLDVAYEDLTKITGQKPVICAAKKSVSNFKVRQGNETGVCSFRPHCACALCNAQYTGSANSDPRLRKMFDAVD